ncbi:MAG: hypothetical protein WC455_31290 [Dehalococcoidia bacterium]|jgi:hypothetical protein
MKKLENMDRRMMSERRFRRECLNTFKRTGALKIEHEWYGPYLVGVHIVNPTKTVFDVLEVA